jgi:hypothetical protein
MGQMGSVLGMGRWGQLEFLLGMGWDFQIWQVVTKMVLHQT